VADLVEGPVLPTPSPHLYFGLKKKKKITEGRKAGRASKNKPAVKYL